MNEHISFIVTAKRVTNGQLKEFHCQLDNRTWAVFEKDSNSIGGFVYHGTYSAKGAMDAVKQCLVSTIKEPDWLVVNSKFKGGK